MEPYWIFFTPLFFYTEMQSSGPHWTSSLYERPKLTALNYVGWSLVVGITNARYHSDSDRQSMRQSHHPVSTSCHRLFIQLTVKIYQKLCIKTLLSQVLSAKMHLEPVLHPPKHNQNPLSPLKPVDLHSRFLWKSLVVCFAHYILMILPSNQL